jgi:hypothetical protein
VLEQLGTHAEIVPPSRIGLFGGILLEAPAKGAHRLSDTAVLLVYGLQGHASSSASKVNCQNDSHCLAAGDSLRNAQGWPRTRGAGHLKYRGHIADSLNHSSTKAYVESVAAAQVVLAVRRHVVRAIDVGLRRPRLS